MQRNDYAEYSDYLFVIYSCKKNLNKAQQLFNFFSLSKDEVALKKCRAYIIYGDPTQTEDFVVNEPYISLKVEDDYDNLYNKSFALFAALTKLYPKSRGTFKCDDDIVINPNTINYYTNIVNNESLINFTIQYLGMSTLTFVNIDNKAISFFFCSGPLYYVNSESMCVLAKNGDFKTALTKIPYFPRFEDLMVGICLDYAEIVPFDLKSFSDDINKYKTVSFHNKEHRKIIYCRLHGGLANVMFQAMSAYFVAKKHNALAFFIYSRNSQDFTHVNNGDPRDAYINTMLKKLSYACIDDETLTVSAINTVFSEVDGSRNCFDYHGDEIGEILARDDVDYLYMYGYFQNEKYFKEYETEVRWFLRCPETIAALENEYSNLPNSYFIHVRRGDYVGNSLYTINYDDYFAKAIAVVLEHDSTAKFYVFSNDIQFCETYSVLKGVNATMVYMNDAIKSIHLMSLCAKGGICSNSTFSWWGSFLNPNPDKLAIYPEKWINGVDARGIYPENAIII